MNNYDMISKGFRIITTHLAPYVCENLKDYYADEWWENGVLKVLKNRSNTELPKEGDYEHLVKSLDAANLLKLINQHWVTIFHTQLGQITRSWVNELIAFRNQWAHKGSEDFTDADTQRLLDTTYRLLEKAGLEIGAQQVLLLVKQMEEEKLALADKRTVKDVLDETPASFDASIKKLARANKNANLIIQTFHTLRRLL